MIMHLTERRDVHCLGCGSFLLEAGEGTNIMMGCKKCHRKFEIKVKDGMFNVQEIMDSADGRHPMVKVSTQRKVRNSQQLMMA